MEDYEDFVQNTLALLRKTEEKLRGPSSSPSSSSSLICFHGRSILPPLLSADHRKEIQNVRDHLERIAGIRKINPVHHNITSDQREITPDPEKINPDHKEITLDHIEVTPDHKKTTSDFRKINPDKREIPSDPEKIIPDHKEILSDHEKITPDHHHITRDAEEIPSDHAGIPSDPRMALVQTILQSVQLRTTPSLEELLLESNGSPTGPDRLRTTAGFSPSDFTEIHQGSGVGVQRHAASTPLIQNQTPNQNQNQTQNSGSLSDRSSLSVSDRFWSGGFFLFSPIDGEELERSGLQICCADTELTAGETSGPEHLDQTGPDQAGPEHLDPEGGAESAVLSGLSVVSSEPISFQSPGDSMTQNPPQNCNTEPSLDPETRSDPDLLEEPDRLSLQALLKKSQEYRRRQRALRSQTRTARTKQQSQVRTEEQNLSDKENQELPEEEEVRRSTTSSSPPQRFWRKETGSGRTRPAGEAQNRRSEEETTFRNNQRNLRTDLDQSQNHSFISLSGTVPDSLDLSFSTAQRYRRVPVPDFCQSPIPIKSRPGLRGCRATNKSLDPHGPVLGRYCGSSSMDLLNNSTVSDQVTLEQLESDLSSLTVLISDLRSTMQQNHQKLDHQNQQNLNQQYQQNLDRLNHQNSNQKYQQNLDHQDQQNMDHQSQRNLNQRESGTGSTRPVDSEFWEPNNTSQGVLEGSGSALSASPPLSGPLRVQQAVVLVPGGGLCDVPLIRTSSNSTTQWKQVPDPFHQICDKTSVPVPSESRRPDTEGPDDIRYPTINSTINSTLNRSYDVDSPSGLWFCGGSELQGPAGQSQLTPDSGGEGQGGATRVKRRLLMHQEEEREEKGGGASSSCAAPPSQWEEQLRRSHAAQVRALQEEHRRQQEELLRREEVLRRMEVQRREALQKEKEHQFSSSLSERCCLLLVAAVKGFLTRRLMRTERMEDLIRTVRDTRLFLQVSRHHNSERNFTRLDAQLEERVSLQLRAARYEVHDVFFSLTAAERMKIISRDRQLRASRLKAAAPRRINPLSAATQKSLERKREVLIQRRTSEGSRGGRGGGRAKLKTRQSLNNPRRTSTSSSRPR